ncbi:MAG: hypothetical protein HZA02_04335 [Nitrospinae bacterium]|nr:hypothetical protein [Nitrospinota bacterium]
MNQSAVDSNNKAPKTPATKRPLKETLWNFLGVVLYSALVVGAVYHLVYEKLK